jgi:hypothetical protein
LSVLFGQFPNIRLFNHGKGLLNYCATIPALVRSFNIAVGC